MVESEDYSASEFEDAWMDDPLLSTKKGGSGRSNSDKKRRFSEEQVKSLELMFETQTKLEPRKKLELAKDLGLHPRQVAIWFQNKRARWKSKQLEREYGSLRADYDALLSKFESVKNEKQLLSKQLQKLAELLDKPMEERGNGSDCSRAVNQKLMNTVPTEETNMKPSISTSDDEENQQELVLFNQVLPIENSSIPTEHQFCFQQPSWPSVQPSITSQWWEFWPMNE